MATSAPPQQPTLSFPPATFAKLSPREYLLAHLSPANEQQEAVRTNGRKIREWRKPHVNVGSLTHAEGSAVVRVGDSTVVCGVRGEILHTRDVPEWRTGGTALEAHGASAEIRNLGLLVPNIELATGCSPAFLPGQPPSTLAQALSTRVLSLLDSSGVVDSEQLRIWYEPESAEDADMDVDADEEGEKREVKAFWTLYIDILFISLDGNAFDVAWAGVLAALGNTVLPKARWDRDRQTVICEDEVALASSLELRGLPVACSFRVFNAGKGKQWTLVDPDTFEEGLCEECVTVVVDEGGSKILGIEKVGGKGVGKEGLKELVKLAGERWGQWKEVLRF
jgi:exosome complex component RRP43